MNSTCLPCLLKQASSINVVALAYLNKMGSLNANTNIFSIQHAHFIFKHIYLSPFEATVFSQPHILSITFSLLFFQADPFMKSFLIPNLLTRVFEFLVASVKPLHLSLNITNLILVYINAYFSITILTKKGYKLLNLQTISTFISQDVNFQKQIFPSIQTATPTFPPTSNSLALSQPIFIDDTNHST